MEEYRPENDRLPLSFKAGVKYPFCDWSLVEPGYGLPFWASYQRAHGCHPWLSPKGVALKSFKPRLGARVAGDEPTGQVGGYSTLIKYKGVYRLYHETYGAEAHGDLGAKLCVATSSDGENWERPNLGLVSYAGSARNNVVFGAGAKATGKGMGCHGAGILFDPDAPSSEKFKLAFAGPPGRDGALGSWLYGAVSRDGLKWKLLPNPLVKTLSDTQNIIASADGGYRLYLRGWSPQNSIGTGGLRTIRLASSPTFGDFGEPEEILRPLAHWGPHVDIYTSSYHRWPGSERELMLPTLYDRAKDTTSVHLAVGQGNGRWDFPFAAPLIEGGDDPALQTVYAGAGIETLPSGDWCFPVHLSEKAHNEYRHRKREIYLMTIREDGFTAIEAELEGTFSLYPAFIEGKRLMVNGWARPGGLVRARVLCLSESGLPQPLPGFDYKDSTPLRDDFRWKELSWSGGGLGELKGRAVRLQFDLLRARIHSFRADS